MKLEFITLVFMRMQANGYSFKEGGGWALSGNISLRLANAVTFHTAYLTAVMEICSDESKVREIFSEEIDRLNESVKDVYVDEEVRNRDPSLGLFTYRKQCVKRLEASITDEEIEVFLEEVERV